MQTNLEHLLRKNTQAAEYYHSMHASIRAMVDHHAPDIKTHEDLIQIANQSMTSLIKGYGGICDDMNFYPQ